MATRRVTRSAATITEQATPSSSLQLSSEPVMEPSQVEPKAEAQPRPKGKRAAPTKAQGAAKKKKVNPPAKPVKGGWVLPHGMGLALEAIADGTAVSSADNNAAVQAEDMGAKVVEETDDLAANTTADTIASNTLPSTAPTEETGNVAEDVANTVVDTMATPATENITESAVKPRATRAPTRQTRTVAASDNKADPLADNEDITMTDVTEEAVTVITKAKPTKARAPRARVTKATKTRTRAAKPAVAEPTTVDDADVQMNDDTADQAIVEPTATISTRRRSTRAAAATANEAILASDNTGMAEDATEPATPTPGTKKAAKRQPRKSGKTPDVKGSGEEVEMPVVALIDQKMKVKRGMANKYGLTRGTTPYPNRLAIPSKEQCEEVHSILTEMHGEVKQPTKAPAPSLLVAGCGEVPSVLDALLRTLISGNTLMANADMAVKRLVETYGILSEGVGAGSINWNAVRLQSLDKLADTIRPAGCPKLKGGHIKAILDMVYEEQKVRAQAHLEKEPVPGAQNEDEGQKALEVQKVAEDYLSLDHMHAMTADEAITEFVRYPGIGVKTAACVVLFCLRIPCFAVDTHVHKFCVWLGWVPEKANELDTFNHGEFTVPDPLKYGLHQLFIRHGQQCFKCRKNTKPGTKAWEEAGECPLEHLLDRSKGNFGRPGKDDDEEVKTEDVDEAEGGSVTTPAKGTKKKGPKAKAIKKEGDEKDTATEKDEMKDDTKDDDTKDTKKKRISKKKSVAKKNTQAAKVDKDVAAEAEDVAADTTQEVTNRGDGSGHLTSAEQEDSDIKTEVGDTASLAVDAEADLLISPDDIVCVAARDLCASMSEGWKASILGHP
jgi:endonuclease III